MIALKKVLVATDFGPASDSALRYGQALARGFGAVLHVLHVTENVFARAMDGYGYTAIPPEVQDDLERVGRKQTEALLDAEDRRELGAAASHRHQQQPRECDRRLRPSERCRPHRHGHSRPRRRRAHVHGKRRGARREDGAVSRADGAESRT